MQEEAYWKLELILGFAGHNARRNNYSRSRLIMFSIVEDWMIVGI